MTRIISGAEGRKLLLGAKKKHNDGKALEEAARMVLSLYSVHWWRVSNYRCFRCGQVQNSAAKGLPDYICASERTGVFFIECKAGVGKLTLEQEQFRDDVKPLPFIELHDTVDGLIEWLEGR